MVDYVNLLIVVAIAFAAPLALGFAPRLRLPVVVVEIVAGIVVGPSGLGWVKVDAPLSILSLIGLSFLLFLAGLEVDVHRLRGATLRLTSVGFLLSFAIAIVLGLLLTAGGFVKSPLFLAIVLTSTSLGVIVPVLKDSRNIASDFGQLVIAAASIADLGTIVLLSIFFSGKGSTDVAGKVILLGVFATLVVVTGLAIFRAEHSPRITRVLLRLQDTTAQIRVRGAFVLLIGFVAIATKVGLAAILGAFAGGALLSIVDQDQAMTHPQFRTKLEAAGFGVFIPLFFIASGLTFDLNALFSSASTVARVPLFFLALLLARGVPAIVYRTKIGTSKSVIAGILQSTSLPFIVASVAIGLQLNIITKATGAGLIAAGLLSVIVFPALGLVLLRRSDPAITAPHQVPTPASVVLSADDRMLCRLPEPSPHAQTSLTATAEQRA